MGQRRARLSVHRGMTAKERVSYNLVWSLDVGPWAIETSISEQAQSSHMFTLKLEGNFQILPVGKALLLPSHCSTS